MKDKGGEDNLVMFLPGMEGGTYSINVLKSMIHSGARFCIKVKFRKSAVEKRPSSERN